MPKTSPSSSSSPSRRQRDVLDYIRRYLADTGISPTQVQIGRALRISKPVVHEHMQALVRKGLLIREAGSHRNYTPAGCCPACGRPWPTTGSSSHDSKQGANR